MNQNKTVSKMRGRWLTAAASVALASVIGFGAVTSGSLPSYADAVRVEGVQSVGFADVVEKVTPAVVSVRVQAKVNPASERGNNFSFGMPGFEDLPRDHPLYRFFREFRGDRDFRGDRPRERRERERARPVAQGSGFFISGDGYLVTNNHVVEGGSEFVIVTQDGDEFGAKLVGTDPRTDLAVLKVDADEEFTYVAFADDSKVRVGDWVVAVGNPFGLGGTVTAGIVSARGRDIGATLYDDFIQIDAAVNRGNSGGPAFNLNGEVVGVNTAIFSPSGGNVGIAFAIPASTANQVVTNLMENGAVMRGWLGVQIQPITDEIAESIGLENAKGALVTDAQADGPGREAGIKAGDVVTAVNDRAVSSPRELARTIGGFAPGEQVEVTLWRAGKEEKLQVKLGELPNQTAKATTSSDDSSTAATALEDLGITVTPAEDGKGVVVTAVEPDSPAGERDIRAGDVIVAINSNLVTSGDDIGKAVEDASKAGRKAVLLQVNRNDSNHFVPLPIS